MKKKTDPKTYIKRKMIYVALKAMYKKLKIEIKHLNKTFITSNDVKFCNEFINCFHYKTCI